MLPFSKSTSSTTLLAVLEMEIQNVASFADKEFRTAFWIYEKLRRAIEVGAESSNSSLLSISKPAN